MTFQQGSMNQHMANSQYQSKQERRANICSKIQQGRSKGSWELVLLLVREFLLLMNHMSKAGHHDLGMWALQANTCNKIPLDNRHLAKALRRFLAKV